MDAENVIAKVAVALDNNILFYFVLIKTTVLVHCNKKK